MTLHATLTWGRSLKWRESMSACNMPSNHTVLFKVQTLSDSVSDTPGIIKNNNTRDVVSFAAATWHFWCSEFCITSSVSSDRQKNIIAQNFNVLWASKYTWVSQKHTLIPGPTDRGCACERHLMVSLKIVRLFFPTVLVPVASLLGSPGSPCSLSHDDLHRTYIHTH